MAESIFQSVTNHPEEPEETIREGTKTDGDEVPQAGLSVPPSQIIWTPRYIVIFGLTLVLGLSIESLLTQGWLNGDFQGRWVLQGHVLLVSLCWVAIVLLAHSSWVRIGGLFGCIWAIFMSIDITLNAQQLNPASPVLGHGNAAICIALLGAYICLSIDLVPFSRWDAWFFGLAPIAGSCVVILTFLLTPANNRSMNTLENDVATTALILCLLVWWIRPSCWKTQPGPTFLFGSVPVILLLLDISNTGMNRSNFFLSQVVLSPIPNLVTNETNFFFSQVVLLCLLLGTMRVLKCEIGN